MEILSVLTALEDFIEKSMGVPLSGKCVIDREELLDFVKRTRLMLPDEIKRAQWVDEKRQEIIYQAQQDSDRMIEETEEKIRKMVDEHEITRLAYQQANDITSGAQKNAREIRTGAITYADSVLKNVQETLSGIVETIQFNRQELK